jgi:transposase InsO family protein
MFTADDPLLRHVRTRFWSLQTNGVIERYFGTLKYEHVYRGRIDDGNALAVEVNLFHRAYDTIRPHQGLANQTSRNAFGPLATELAVSRRIPAPRQRGRSGPTSYAEPTREAHQ